jgi:hypothetical protein
MYDKSSLISSPFVGQFLVGQYRHPLAARGTRNRVSSAFVKRLLAALGCIFLIGGTLSASPAQSADRDANGDSSTGADAARDRSVEARVKKHAYMEAGPRGPVGSHRTNVARERPAARQGH